MVKPYAVSYYVKNTSKTRQVQTEIDKLLIYGNGIHVKPCAPFVYNSRPYYLANQDIAVVLAETAIQAKTRLSYALQAIGLIPETTTRAGDFNINRAKAFEAFSKTGSFDGQSAIRSGNRVSKRRSSD